MPKSVSKFCTEVVLALPDCLAEGQCCFCRNMTCAGLSITVVSPCSSCLICIASSHPLREFREKSERWSCTDASGLMKAEGGRFDLISCSVSRWPIKMTTLNSARSSLAICFDRRSVSFGRSFSSQAPVSQPHKFTAPLPLIVVH